MTIRDDELRRLLELVLQTSERELDCDEFLERAAAYLDRAAASADTPLFADVRAHLAVCPECLEEFEALLAARGGARSDESASGA